MAARRLIVVLVVLLAVSTALAVVAPRPELEEDDEPESAEQQARGERPERASRPTGGRHLERTIEVEPGSPGPTVRIAVGDQLTLTVRSEASDQIELIGLGITRDAGPESPARFDILPFEPGIHPLRLLEAGEDVAEVRVVRRR